MNKKGYALTPLQVDTLSRCRLHVSMVVSSQHAALCQLCCHSLAILACLAVDDTAVCACTHA